MSKRVIIIGAGPGGLAAAMLLAKQGARVTVLEQQPNVGGRTRSFESDGFRFDLGPTFFLYPDVLQRVFAQCGYDLWSELDLRPIDPMYRLIFEGGGSIDASGTRDRMREQIARISPRDAAGLDRYLHDNRRKFAAFKPILERPFNGWRDLLKLNPFSVGPLVRPWTSVDSDLRRYFHDERVRLAFCFQSKYLGMSPFQCPSLFTILAFLEHEYGVYHPVGGCGRVSEVMADLAARLGAEIRLNEPVRRMCFSGRRFTGVETDRGVTRGDAVVINADFADAMHKLVPDTLRRRWTNSRIARKKFSCSTFMMYLGVRGRYDHLRHHTIFLPSDYERNLQEIERDHVLSQNPSVYVQNACVTEPQLAPRGMSTLYVLAPVTHQHANVDWGREAPVFRERVLNQLGKLGLDDLRDRIVYERVVTPDDWSSSMAVHRGATFNLAHTFGQMLHLRPRNRFEDLESVYLVGGGTHPGSGLPVIYQSALISSELIAGDLGLAAPRPMPQTTPAAREPARPELARSA